MYELLQRHPRLARALELIGSAILINVLALLASMTVIGLPPAILASFVYLGRLLRRQPVDLVDHFVAVFRTHFLQSWMVLLAVAVPAGLAIANVAVADAVPFGQVLMALSAGLGLVAVAASIYLWPLAAAIDRPLGELVLQSVRVALGHLAWSLGTMLAAGSIVALSIAVPAFGGVAGYGFTVLLVSAASWRVIGRYTTSRQGTEPVPAPQP